PLESLEQLRVLVGRARAGEASALAALRATLDRSPALWRRAGDLAALTERSWAELASGGDPLLMEALLRKLEEGKSGVAGPAPTPLERLLVERVAASWIEVNYCDLAVTQLKDASPKLMENASRRQDRAHRRHLATIGALATVRKLLPHTGREADSIADGAEAGDDQCEGSAVRTVLLAFPGTNPRAEGCDRSAST